jgi:hypothetical protein
MSAPNFEQVKRVYAQISTPFCIPTDEDAAFADNLSEDFLCKLDDAFSAAKDGKEEPQSPNAFVESAEFERIFKEYYSGNGKDTGPTGPADIENYDLLPFDLWDNKRQTVVPAEGYSIDKEACPHGTEGARRKRGPLSHQRFWRKTKTGKRQFFHGYRMTIKGKRKWVTDRSLALARFNAERKRDGQDSYF